MVPLNLAGVLIDPVKQGELEVLVSDSSGVSPLSHTFEVRIPTPILNPSDFGLEAGDHYKMDRQLPLHPDFVSPKAEKDRRAAENSSEQPCDHRP